MKGLILKDILNLKQQLVIYIIFAAVWGALAAMTHSLSVFFGLLGLMMVMLPTSAISYDERSKWDVYALTTPVSRSGAVLSKYILAWFAAAFALAFMAAPTLISSAYGLTDFLSGVIILSCMMISVSISIPLQFKFGGEKGRLVSVLFIAIPAIFVAGSGAFSDTASEMSRISATDALAAAFIMIGIAAAAQAASVWASVRIYRNKDF